MHDLLQFINATSARRLLHRMQCAKIQNQALAGWRARSAQVRKGAGLRTMLRRHTPEEPAQVDVAGESLWLN